MAPSSGFDLQHPTDWVREGVRTSRLRFWCVACRGPFRPGQRFVLDSACGGRVTRRYHTRCAPPAPRED